MREVQECPKGPGVNNPLLIGFIVFAAIVVFAVAVFGATAAFRSHGSTRLNLVDGISVDDIDISGYDGNATAKVDDVELRDLISYKGDDEDVKRFIDTVTYEVSPDSDISNDDSITVKAIYDRTDAKDAKVKIVDDNVSFTVSGLDYGSDYDSGSDSYSDGDYNNDYNNNNSNDYYTDSDYTTYLVDAWDGYAAVRTGRGTDYEEVGKIWNDETVDVYNYSGGWYQIATGRWKGYYLHESSLEEY